MLDEKSLAARQEQPGIYKNIPADLLGDLIGLGMKDKELKEINDLNVGDKINGWIGAVEWTVVKEEDGAYTFYTGEGSQVSPAILAARAEKRSTHTEQECAEDYWKEHLEKEKRIDKQQNPHCEFAFVIPVFNEQPERILRQLDSFRRQQGVPTERFEVIFVVNNDVKSNDDIRVANERIIELLEHVTDLNVFVIDKSSRGNEITNCNVGKARNRGLAEASRRFYESGKNGVIIQIDADTYLSDNTYLLKLSKLFEDNPEVIEVVGEFSYEFSLEAESEDEMAMKEKLRNFVLSSKRKFLTKFLLNPDDPNAATLYGFSTGGPHMVSKSFESAAIGGFVDTNIGEDNQFMGDLVDYARGHNKKVIQASNLKVTTAIRDSDRTDASLGKDFADKDSANAVLAQEVEELERKVLQQPNGRMFIDILNKKMESIKPL